MAQSNLSGPLNITEALIVGGTASFAGLATFYGGQTFAGDLNNAGGTINTALLNATQGLRVAGTADIGGNITNTAGTITTGFVASAEGAHLGGVTDYVEISPTGMITMHGTATVWDDLRVSAATAKGGNTPPDFDVWKGGIRLWAFDASTEQSVHFELQMPHSWKLGSRIYPHVHWIPKVGGTAGQVVSWGLEYAWQSIGGTYSGLGTAYGTAHLPGDASLIADKHYLTQLGTAGLDGSGQTLSSMLMCRLFRDATGAGLADTLGNDAFMLEFDVHYEMDTFGSNEELIK